MSRHCRHSISAARALNLESLSDATDIGWRAPCSTNTPEVVERLVETWAEVTVDQPSTRTKSTISHITSPYFLTWLLQVFFTAVGSSTVIVAITHRQPTEGVANPEISLPARQQ